MLKRLVLTIAGIGKLAGHAVDSLLGGRGLVGLGQRQQGLDVTRLMMRTPVAPPLAIAPHLAVQLVDREVDGGVHVLGGLVARSTGPLVHTVSSAH